MNLLRVLSSILPGSRARRQLQALYGNQAVVEFDPAGKVLSANAQFLVLMGDTLDTLRGQHHRIFLDVTEHDEQACRAFWEQLRRGEAFVGRCKRRTGAGQDARLGAVHQAMGQLEHAVVRA